MEIADILTPARIAVDVRAASKKSVLEELARLVARDAPELTPAQAFDSLIVRERLGSTGLGNGIAIPHGRIDHLPAMLGAFLKVEPIVSMDSMNEALRKRFRGDVAVRNIEDLKRAYKEVT